MAEILPQVGDWYRKPTGNVFEVVAIDESDSTVELQHYDGTVEEIDIDSWEEMSFEPSQPPEDWTGSFDMAKEDYGVDYNDSPVEAWANPLDYLDVIEL